MAYRSGKAIGLIDQGCSSGVAADKAVYFSSTSAATLFDLTSAGRALMDDADASAQRTTLGLVLGTDVQAWDTDLDAIAALSESDGTFIVGSGSGWVAESGDTARTSLGVGTGDSPTFTNLTLSGDLTVQGTTTTVDSEEILIRANYQLLNVDYTTDAAVTGGIVVNVDPDAGGTEAVSGSGFTSTTVVEVASTTGLAAGDIIQVSGSTSNDGFYEIASVVADTSITIDSTPSEDFSSTAFTVEAAAGQVDKIKVAVIRAGTDGVWETATGSTVPLTYLDLADASGSISLDNAYETGATISMDSANGDLVVSGEASGSWTWDDQTAALTQTGTGLVTLTGNLDATLGVDVSGGDLTLSGGVATLTANGASSLTTSSGALTLTSAAAATWSTTAGALTLDGASGISLEGNSSEIDLTSTGAIDINSGAGTWDASTLSLDGTDTTNLTMTANAAGNKTLTLSAANSGAGEGLISISSDAQVDITDGTATLTLDGGALSESAMASADISVSGALTLTGAGSASMGDDVGTWEFDGAGAVSETGMTSLSATVSGALTLTGAGSASMGDDVGTWEFDGAGAVSETGMTSLSATVSGALTLTGGGSASMGDDVGTWEFDGAGAVSETGMTSLSVTPSGAVTLTAGAASTWSTSSGDLTMSAGGLIDMTSTLRTDGRRMAVVTEAGATHTVVAAEDVIIVSAATCTVDLPAATGTGQRLVIKATNASPTVTIDGSGAETIDGDATLVLSVQYESVTLIDYGSGTWAIV
jgi:hypothetical protein